MDFIDNDKKEKKRNYQREYRTKNVLILREKRKQYYEKNKEKIEEYNSEHFKCSCGVSYMRKNKSQHYKTHSHFYAYFRDVVMNLN